MIHQTDKVTSHGCQPWVQSESMPIRTGACGRFMEVSILRKSIGFIRSEEPATKIHQTDNVINHGWHLRACPVAQVLRLSSRIAGQKTSLIGCNLVCPKTMIHGNISKTMHGSF